MIRKFNFLDIFSKKNKIGLVRAKLFHTDRWTDRQMEYRQKDSMAMLIGASRNFAKSA